MIPREHVFRILVLATVLSITQSQNSRSYDTSDWIPLTKKCATCHQNDEQKHVIEKKATGRVLNLAEPDPNREKFFPDEPIIRNKKSNRGNVQQYLREVSPPAKRLPKRQGLHQGQPLQLHGLPQELGLNEGEFVNQQYLQPQQYQQLPPAREYQRQPQQLPQQIQITNTQPLLQQPPQLVAQAQQYFPGQQLIPQPLFDIPGLQGPGGLNLYQQNYQNLPLPPQPQNIQGINKSKQYEALNPGIQAINQGLAEELLSNSNKNLNNFRQVSVTSTSPKPEAEKETVQLLYVPIESLNQRHETQAQIQKQQEAIIQQQQQAEYQREQLKAQEEERVKSEREQQLKAQREQELKAQQELQLKAQQEQEQKAQQEQELKAQQLKAQREQEVKALQEQRQRAQDEAVLRQQQLIQQQEAALQQEQHQQAQNQQVVYLQQEQPLQQVHLLQDTQTRRRPTRPTAAPQYQTRIPTIQQETPLEHKQQQLLSIENDFAQQALDALKLQVQLQQGQIPESVPQVSTTPRPVTIQPSPKKRKPHQPPLAVYMGADGEVTISDVLNVLKNAKSISVQDNVGPQSPQVFVGPHNLEPPEGYAKFELPYLSALESNRVERKVDQLPFFVAPLSYKAPPGYSKIPLPAPHVGSVVVSHKDDGPEKREQPPYRLENLLNEQPYRLPNLPPYQIEPQLRPIKPFKLENAINEEPYRIPTQPQALFNPFATATPNPPTPTASVTSRPELLGQTINQYELEQINNQFLPQAQVQPQVEYQPSQLENDTPNEYEEVVSTRRPHSRGRSRVSSTTPTIIPSTVQYATENPREIQTTRRVDEIKSRHSARPTQRTVSSTQSNADKYTVLEEFSIKRKPQTTTSRVAYAEISTATTTTSPQTFPVEPEPQLVPQPQLLQHPSLPSSVSRLAPQNIPQLETHFPLQFQPETQQSPQPLYSSTAQQQLNNQQVLRKEELQQQGQLNNLPSGPPQTFYQIDESGRYVPIQTVEGDQYRLVNQQAFQHDLQAFREVGLVSTTTPEAPKEIITTTVKSTEKPIEQSTRTSTRSNSRSRTRGRTQYVPEQYRESSEEKDEVTENYKLPAELPSINPSLHGLINDLQNQALRPLLVPASIAPTTEHVARSQSTTPQQEQQRHHSVYLEQQPQLQRQPQPQQQYILEQPQQQPQQQYILEQPQQQQQQYILQEQHPQNQLLLQQQPQRQLFLQQQQPQQQLILEQQEQLPVKIQPQQQLVLVASTEAEPPTTTHAPLPLSFEVTTAPAVITTTPNRRQRGRQRARGSSTTTSAPRRTAQRTRKPTSRSRTEQSRYQQELIDEYGDYLPVKSIETHTKETVSRQEVDYDTETSRKSSSRQRSRTRGRPIQELTERTSISTSAEESNFKQPPLQSGFQGSSSPHLIQPQSYMQFEQPFETVQLNQPSRVESYSGRDQIVKQYQPVYKVEQEELVSAEPLPVPIKQAPVDSQKFSVDVLINHPITETASKEPVLISQPEDDSTYVRYNSNLESSGRLQKQELQTTTKSSAAARTRGRGRGRSRTKPTTQRPAPTTVNHIRTTTTEESQEGEFYGFIRPPNFNRPSLVAYQPKPVAEEPKLYSATYLSTTGQPNRVHYEDQPVENSNTVQIVSNNAVSSKPRVQFLGKIRPKYSPHPTKTEESIEVTTEAVTTEKRYTVRTTKPSYSAKTTKPRVRGRLRVPTRKPQTDSPRPTKKSNQLAASPARDPHRFKQRGVSHFQLPETLKSKATDDEDVEGGNYPQQFLQVQETQTEESKFQINLEPELEDNLSIEDQVPYSSIYSPKIVRKNIGDKEETTNVPEIVSQVIPNDIPIQRKIVESQEEITALPIISTTESIIKVEEKNYTKPEQNNTEAEKTILEDFLGDVEDTFEEDEAAQNNPANYKDYLDLEDQDSASTSTSTNKPKTRRRGSWRLVKRPVDDAFETAESQYVGTVFSNSFATDEDKKGTSKLSSNKGEIDDVKTVFLDDPSDSIVKDKPAMPETETTTANSQQTESSSYLPELTSLTSQDSFLDSLYKIFGMADNIQKKQDFNDKSDKLLANSTEATTQPPKSDDTPAKASEETKTSLDEPIQISLINSSVDKQEGEEKQEQKFIESVTEPPVLQTESSISSQLPIEITQNLDPQADTWDFGNIKTSTSTEVSHETEICYRGRCVKSSGTKIPKV